MFVLYFLATTIAILWSWFYYTKKEFYKKLEPIDGPKGVWLLGNALDFPTLNHIIPSFMRYHQEFDGLAKLKLGPERNVSISRYSYLEKILSSTKYITKSREYRFLKRWLQEGLLTSTREKWQQRRKLLTPAFHFQILEQVVDVFNGAGNELIRKLKTQTGKATDIYDYVTLCTLDVIVEAAMGIKINAQDNEKSEYVQSVKTMGQIAIKRTSSALKQFELLYRLSMDYQRERKALKILHSTTDKIIKQRRDEILNANKNTTNEVCGKKRKLAFLDLLLAAEIDGKPLSNSDIREEVDTFMFEGHDTTASGISFAMYCLAKHPDVQEKAFQEQQELFTNDLTRSVTFNDLNQMEYLEMVIKEVLRMYPPVPVYGRVMEKDEIINGTLFPKDLDISIFAYGAMRNPEYFPNPEVFDPERFSTDNKINIKPYAYIPFSAGPRNCIGKKFAMMELKSTLSKIIRNFKLHAVEGFTPNLSAESILKSSNGVVVRLEEIKL